MHAASWKVLLVGAVMALASICSGTAFAGEQRLRQPISRPGCPLCHGDPRIESEGAGLYVDPNVLDGSAHEGLTCTSCHPALGPVIHEDPAARLAATYASCLGCHPQQAGEVRRGLHFRASEGTDLSVQAATLGQRCVLCHGSHRVVLIRAGFLPQTEGHTPPGLAIVLMFLFTAGTLAVVIGAVVSSLRFRRARAWRRAGPIEGYGL